jgi:FkbM family methyltransferase
LLKPAQFDSDLEIFLWDYTPADGDVILDIGAGTGTEAVRLSRLVGPTGRVIAVEAHPDTFAVLAKVSAANRIHNITTVEAAVAGVAGTLHITDNDEVGSNTLFGDGAIEVRATTIDDIIAECHVERVDFLKMNIEGAERLAIQGMDHTVARVERMAISCHDFLGTEWGATRSVVYRWLIDQGFQVRSRPDDPRRWCQDYLYASRPVAPNGVLHP